jgi:hypothetical protein
MQLGDHMKSCATSGTVHAALLAAGRERLYSEQALYSKKT